jgi:uncharacterized membrane protein YfhO
MRIFSKAVSAPIICFLVLQVLIFSRMMNFEMRRDEQLYAPPARLLSEYHLYSDLFYNHTPGSAWLFYGFMTGLGTDHLLLAARLGVFAAWAAFGIALIAITYKLTFLELQAMRIPPNSPRSGLDEASGLQSGADN